MRLRPANATDADEGASLLRRSITDLCGMDHGSDPLAIEVWTANKTSASWTSWLERHPFFYIVENRDILAGVCLLSMAGEILLNYVHPAFRFRGVSKLMLSEMETTAARNGMNMLRVRSTKTAYRFYRSAGFVEVAEEEAYLLQKPLKASFPRDEAGGSVAAKGATP